MNCCSPSAATYVFQAFVIFLFTSVVYTYNEYCIIGAGPGGLQMGYFFKKSGRDYVIFEKSNVSGNFFVQYPRHRKLISINKRHTGKTNKEFNMRHDWNSLLSDDEELLLKYYSKEMFPPADSLLKYLHDYQTRLGLNVQFNTEIRNIKAEACEHADDKIVYTMTDQHGTEYRCGKLIVATGIAKANIPNLRGIEYTEGYEDMSVNPDDYEGQTVLILGRGNSAFETADTIYGATNLIHMVGRSRVRLSWATHYVGDLRAVNNGLLDTYQLKSLDGVLEASIDEVWIEKQEDGKLHLRVVEEESNPDQPAEDELFDNFAMREPYDRILRCLGFTFDSSIFNESMIFKEGKGRLKKYPPIHHNYESVNHPGMFIAGTASHSLDFRKSAGGFIHGFRYTARALHNLLEWRYHGVKWPSTSAPLSQLLTHIIKRLNEASGTYQMFSVLGDVVILNGDDYIYLDEYPINLVHQIPERTGHHADRIIVINLQYGLSFSSPGNDIFRLDRATGDPSEAHKSNFLHPALYYYSKLPTEKDMKTKAKKEHLPRPDALHHIVEDFLTTWDGPISHILPLRRFLERVFDIDLRDMFASTCFEMALTGTTVPYTCREYYLKGQGLTGSHVHQQNLKVESL